MTCAVPSRARGCTEGTFDRSPLPTPAALVELGFFGHSSAPHMHDCVRGDCIRDQRCVPALPVLDDTIYRAECGRSDQGEECGDKHTSADSGVEARLGGELPAGGGPGGCGIALARHRDAPAGQAAASFGAAEPRRALPGLRKQRGRGGRPRQKQKRPAAPSRTRMPLNPRARRRIKSASPKHVGAAP